MRTEQVTVGQIQAHAAAGSTRELLRFIPVDSGQTVSCLAIADDVHYSVNLELEVSATAKLHRQKVNA